LIKETNEMIRVVPENKKVARSRQKSYIDTGRKPFKFQLGDKVLLHVSP